MEEEDDYMSDKILSQCLESNIRPGLLFTNKQRRDLNIHKKKQQTTRPFKQIAEEKREEGLNTAIPETNKGFVLLKKMGYTPGLGIGKSEAGPCNPISLEIREDKSGLGLKAEKQEKQKIIKQTIVSTFHIAIRKRKELRDLKYDYWQIRRACQHFDEKDDLKGPLKKWFWPDPVCSPKDEEDENDVVKREQKSKDTDISLDVQNFPNTPIEVSDSDEECKKPLELLTGEELEWRIEHIDIYLREKYNYCIWCGFQFDDEKDMQEDCPGRTRQDHDGTTRHVESDHDNSH